MKILKLAMYAFIVCFCSVTYGQQFNYGEALQKSLFFYEVQQSGKLPSWNRVSWKNDSGMDHGKDVGLDLTGGWYDAGDNVKFNFPMAASVTMLAWGGIEYEDAYRKSGQFDILKRNLKFALDYMIKCHSAKNELYIQIGKGTEDHKHWVTAEGMTAKIPQRPSLKVDTSNGGTDIAAEFAAAFSASSILFKDSDPAFSATLIRHAEELYEFADKYRGLYSDSNKDTPEFYRSWSGYQDELVWGAAWLYRATNKMEYLTKAEKEYQEIKGDLDDGKPYSFAHSWDDKSYGSYVLLSQLTGKEEYKTAAQNHLNFWTVGHNGERVTYTPGGQAWLVQWGSLRYAGTTSFLALVYSDKVDIPADLKKRYFDFAKGQANYTLGDNPLNRSFMCGFGNNPPFDPHHRTAHGSWVNSGRSFPETQSHILYGAVVGGPKTPDDKFVDDRTEFLANEVATDYNAGLTGVLVRLYDEYGGNPLANFPVAEVPTRDEFRTIAKFNSNNATSYTPSMRFENRSAWPARNANKVTMRYFFNISEAQAAGFTINDFEIRKGYSQGPSTIATKAWDAAKGIYYVEVSLEEDDIWPVGESEHRREVQLNISVKGGTPFDVSNDWSARGVTSNDYQVSSNIPVYDNGVLVFGNEPDGSEGPTVPTNTDPVASFTADKTNGDVPLVVSFDGSGSSDADGDTLTYNWNFGNGQTSTQVNPLITFDSAGSYRVSLTVNDGNGGSDSEEITITATSEVDPNPNPDPDPNPTPTPSGDCTFGTPTAAPLASVNTSYENMHVLGAGGPAFSNFLRLTVNWDLANNGLYQFAFNTNDGTPSWYFNLSDSVVQNFASASPAITLSNTGVQGLDGAYYATIDNGNFVMVSQTGGYTLYFSKSATAPKCDTGTNPEVVVDGGTITGGPFAFVVGDGQPDNVSGISLSGNEGDNSTWIITDADNNILGLPATLAAVENNDFDVAPVGKCLIWHLSYQDGLTGAVAGNNLSALTGDFDLSNSITVDRNAPVVTPPTPTEDCTFGTPLASGLPSINSSFENVFVLGNGGPNLDNVTEFIINWDAANNGLYVLAANTSNGTPNWYVDLNPSASNTFVNANPEITLSGTGFAGLDGSYYVAIDNGNFVMVSKTAGFAIYFSKSATRPECGETTPVPPVATVDGGTVSSTTNQTAITTTTGDGIADLVTFQTTSTATASYEYLITDADGNILTTEASSHDFEGATVGVCRVYGISYEGNLSVSGKNVADAGLATGAFEVSSNAIVITRQTEVVTGPTPTPTPTADNAYINRFIELRKDYLDPANGYFSKDGSPHHSVESLIVEAPDHGHESTSELYSFWLWLEVMNGRITKDWSGVAKVWDAMEKMIIPTTADQPSNSAYNPSKPAGYAAELDLPSKYPSPLNLGAGVGNDPVSNELTAAYGPDVYQMHWLLDNDNFYGFGNRGDGVSTPSYINTFSRGVEESVYETVPHPSWESFEWGGENGFLPLFIEDSNYSKQWRYTSAPDADARAVQAMYWAVQYAKEQGTTIPNTLLKKTTKMGDYLRIAMFDKYFKKLGAQSEQGGAGNGYDSAHYLMSWYISWGGSADPASNWAFRISSSHCHFGYQNPVAAYAMSQVAEFEPETPNGKRDWNTSLERQIEFYQFLQSKEGGIAGGATNSFNGNYSPYPNGASTFYDMVYQENPVYADPGSGGWFGWQVWSMERIAEYYYISGDAKAKQLIDKWSAWAIDVFKLVGEDDIDVPAGLAWTGQPDTWNPNNPGTNDGLSVEVTSYNKDLGVAATTAKTLIYYAAATQKYGTLNQEAKNLAKEILDRMWNKYRDDKGLSALEKRSDFSRLFEEEVYIPQGFSGTMPNGDVIEPGVTFLDIRSNYKNDPDFDRLKAAYDAGEDFEQNYHRGWALIDIALANAEYGFFFGDEEPAPKAAPKKSNLGLKIYPNPVSAASGVLNISATTGLDNSVVIISDLNGRTVKQTTLTSGSSAAQIDISGLQQGMYILKLTNDTEYFEGQTFIVK